MNVSTPISQLTRVGKTTAVSLKRLGIITAGNLLHYFPFRYEDFRQIVPISALRGGETVTVKGTIEVIGNRRTRHRGKMITEALVADDTGSIRVVWFNQPFLTKIILPGEKIFLSGLIKNDILGPQFVSPVYEKVSTTTISTARLVPMYPLTAGVTQKQIRFLVQQVLPLATTIPDWLPHRILENYDLLPLPAALKGIHFPIDEFDFKASTERLKFDELFIVQLQAELNREARLSHHAPKLAFHELEIKQFVERLPFTLTKTQKIAAWEILQDIAKPMPMNRLLSGDVGSGKTVVAAMVLYSTILNGYQGVLMAPTEILAEQHFESLKKLFADLPVTIGLLTASKVEAHNYHSERSEESLAHQQFAQSDNRVSQRSLAPLGMTERSSISQKRDLVDKINGGGINIIIGTHALLSKNIHFKNLGLVIVDEQHRFGVEQRKVIKEKGVTVHFLSMTATPIPRSLALMLYGDLDVSIISELPPGRKPIITRLVEPAKREKAYGFIREQVRVGLQVFVVCPLIENTSPSPSSERKGQSISPSLRGREEGVLVVSGTSVSDKKSVLSEYEKLSKKIFPDLKVDYLHGKLKPKEKDVVMEKFKKGEIDILVSTSVVEVGVDIPNASVMMIEGADRFGLAQLHQFRGRVGRSSHQSYCLLFTDSDSARVLERLKYFEVHRDGFKLAEKDLEMRGPGEVYGVEQSGMQELRLAKLTDREIIKKAREAARQTVPEIERYPNLLEKIKEWERVVHLE